MTTGADPQTPLDDLHAHANVRVLAVVGPTAVGKSALAEQLALRCGGEVISADSMQVYRGMDVGTAKTPQGERLVTHHCIDIAEPGEPFSAALYQTQARASIGDVSSRGLLPVVCGGTGLYVRAALDDLRFPSGEQAENPVRAKYEQLAQTQGAGALHALLATREPQSAALIHPNNVRRVVRALEMLDADGVSYAAQHAGLAIRASVYDTRFVGLTMDRAALYERIDARVDRMMDEGLLGEVERLLDAGLRSALTSAQAIGYKELVQTLDGTTSLEVAVAAIKQASRRYAKRQLTWFRADKRIRWVDVTGLSPAEQVEAALHEIDW